MRKNILYSLMILILTVSLSAQAQILSPVHWSYAAKKIDKTTAFIFVKATIEGNWHIYSTRQPDGGPVKTSFRFDKSPRYTLIGAVSEPKYITKYEKSFSMDVHYFESSVVFQQKIKLNAPTAVVKGTVNFMACNDQKCLPPDDVSFKIPVK